MSRAVLYARVSTLDKNQDPETQLRQLREYATRRTDGWSGYAGAAGHDPHVIGPMAAHVVLPWVHRVFANLKRWVLGVSHGLRSKHLQSYLDEFVFRFNRRRNRPAAFRSLLRIGAATKPVTYNTLIAPETTG